MNELDTALSEAEKNLEYHQHSVGLYKSRMEGHQFEADRMRRVIDQLKLAQRILDTEGGSSAAE